MGYWPVAEWSIYEPIAARAARTIIGQADGVGFGTLFKYAETRYAVHFRRED